ncbi:MAG: hypothetical protein M3R02_13980 [Chloroflexota bacterium]|nr:hypothetical protein [Chloroflexota bacterium]
MSIVIRCRRCGREFVADRRAILAGRWSLCPACRGPLPPTSGVPATDEGLLFPCPPEAA